MRLLSGSTGAASNIQTLLLDSLTGANATSTQTTYGERVYNRHTGTASTNYGSYVSARSGTNNISSFVDHAATSASCGLQISATLGGNSGTPTGTYLRIGGLEYSINYYWLIKFGYGSNSVAPAYIGYQELNSGGNTTGDLVFGTRPTTTAVDGTERMRIKADGSVGIGINPTVPLHFSSTASTTTAGQFDFNSLTTGIGLAINSSSITTGNLLKLTSTSTAGNNFTLGNIVSSGANANATRTVTGQTITVTNTGTTSTNIGLSLSASGATTNHALYFPTNASIIHAVGTGANGLVLSNLKNSTNTSATGTAITIEISIGGTPYYFLAYPTTAP
jgi:hypothetical protein